jgi:hypothetical protein
VVKEIERRIGLNESFMRVLSVLHVPAELTPAQPEGEAIATPSGEDGPDE